MKEKLKDLEEQLALALVYVHSLNYSLITCKMPRLSKSIGFLNMYLTVAVRGAS